MKIDSKYAEEWEKQAEEREEWEKQAKEEREGWEEYRKEYQESLKKNKLENPHLALISDHLWWLALLAKISLGMMILSIIGAILLGS